MKPQTLELWAGTGVPGSEALTVSATAHTSYVERAAGASVVGAATLTDQPVRLLITRAPSLGGKKRRQCVLFSSVGLLNGVKAVEMAQSDSHYYTTTSVGGEPVAPVV